MEEESVQFRESIFDAAKNGDVHEIHYYIEKNYALLDATQNGKTPAYVAFENKHCEIGLALIKAKCRNLSKILRQDYLSKTFVHGQTIFHVAAQFSDIESFKKLTEMVDDKCLVDNNDNNALMLACANKGQKAIVEHLHQLDASLIHQKNISGRTALHIALHKGCSQIATWLLNLDEMQKHLYQPDSQGYKPIHLAVFGNNKVCVEKLLEKGVNIEEGTDRDGSTALHLVAQYDKQETLSVFLRLLKEDNVNVKDRYGRTPVHLAAQEGHCEILDCLERCGADLNAMAEGDLDNDVLQGTPLHYAIKNKEFLAVQRLLHFKVDLSKTHDDTGITPLHMACEIGEKIIVEMLRRAKAPYALTKDNRSVLHFACKSQSSDLVAFLLKENIPVYQKADDGVLPIHVSAEHSTKDVIELLINNGASFRECIGENKENAIHVASNAGNAAVLKCFLYRDEMKAELKAGLGFQLLIGAAKHGQYESIKLLLQFGVPIDAKDEYQKTALHHLTQTAARLLNEDKQDEIGRYKEAIECLLRLGANYNLKDNHGRTPLSSVEKTPSAKAGLMRAFKLKKIDGNIRYENEKIAEFLRKLIRRLNAEIRASYYVVEKQLRVGIGQLEKRAADLKNGIEILVNAIVNDIEGSYPPSNVQSQNDVFLSESNEQPPVLLQDDTTLSKGNLPLPLLARGDMLGKGKEEESDHKSMQNKAENLPENTEINQLVVQDGINKNISSKVNESSPNSTLPSKGELLFSDLIKEKMGTLRSVVGDSSSDDALSHESSESETFAGYNLLPPPPPPEKVEEDSYDAWKQASDSVEKGM